MIGDGKENLGVYIPEKQGRYNLALGTYLLKGSPPLCGWGTPVHSLHVSGVEVHLTAT